MHIIERTGITNFFVPNFQKKYSKKSIQKNWKKFKKGIDKIKPAWYTKKSFAMNETKSTLKSKQ